MGTGKTKVVIDTAAYLYSQNRIQCLFVVAPNGVHANWILREVPIHMPDWCDYRMAVWSSQMKKAEEKAYEDLFDPNFVGLRVIAFNVESFGVPERYFKKKANAAARALLNAFKCLMAIDESSKIKTPGAKRTRRLLTLGKYAAYRRVLTGTPVTNSPLDIYAQIKFLGAKYLGFSNFYSFKHRYAEWIQEKNWKTGKAYESLVGYRHIEELVENLSKISFRVTKKECLDLPEKEYMRRMVAMEGEQFKKYKKLREDSILELRNDESVTVANILTKMLRLQQLLGGFLPSDDPDQPGTPLYDNPETNPRIKALLDITDETSSKVIIWARFRNEIEMISRVLRKHYGQDSVVEYHGGVKDDQREIAINSFQDESSRVRFFIGQQHSGGYGITLTAASYMIYYSNDFSLEARLQSEDRAHRIGQKNPVTYVDLEVEGTIDTRIINALRDKKKIADTITQDDSGSWL